MADRTNYGSESGSSIKRTYVELKFQLNGAGTPTVLQGKSYLDASTPVSHTGGTNVYGVKMRDRWPEAVCVDPDCRDDAGNGQYVTAGNIANEGGTTPSAVLTFNLRTFNATGSAQNDSNLIVSVMVALRNSNTTYGNQ